MFFVYTSFFFTPLFYTLFFVCFASLFQWQTSECHAPLPSTVGNLLKVVSAFTLSRADNKTVEVIKNSRSLCALFYSILFCAFFFVIIKRAGICFSLSRVLVSVLAKKMKKEKPLKIDQVDGALMDFWARQKFIEPYDNNNDNDSDNDNVVDNSF